MPGVHAIRKTVMDRTATSSRGRAPGELPGNKLPKIAYGKGIRLFDVQGRTISTWSGGPRFIAWATRIPKVNASSSSSLTAWRTVTVTISTSDPLEELTEIVAKRCGPGYERMIFTTGGSKRLSST